MDNQEPVQAIQAVIANTQTSQEKSDIPEQVSIAKTCMPRQISILSWINQWQPMGYRLIVALPFIGNDEDFFFAIRNGPFIPTRSITPYYDPAGTTSFNNIGIFGYAFNNMTPVIIPSNTGTAYPSQTNPSISVVSYDMPPPIATMAQSFRRWRGDMQYRIRMVAGFATQGYIIATTVKNVFSPIGIYDSFKYRPVIQRQDLSYRASMINSYALADTSMYRHFEISMPYDYPVPYYDQFAWISRRVSPGEYFESTATTGTGPPYRARVTALQDEPHGDNWIVFGLRGNLEAAVAGAQVVFELEYRCAEGFQFADPFFPPTTMRQTMRSVPQTRRVVTFPSASWTSDGVGLYSPISSGKASTRHPRGVNVGVGGDFGGINIGTMRDANINEEPKERKKSKKNRSPNRNAMDSYVDADGKHPIRIKREQDSEEEGEDTVDVTTLSALDRLRIAAQQRLGTTSRNAY